MFHIKVYVWNLHEDTQEEGTPYVNPTENR